jgi:histidyl-tRNA synthetase
MKILPLKGTCDYLPEEVALRDYLQNTILSVYRAAGYERISTPAIEDIENIDKSEGGDNLALIFKILKRGEKLEKALEGGDAHALCDMGLRYDLTLPLSRYYANNRLQLLTPAKCIQTDRVWRAERPQKGRLREFIQCDIDILGSSSPTCEVDLIVTTARALSAVGMKDFTVHINDRSLLLGVLSAMGVPAEMNDTVCVSLDKLDKVGVEGVRRELEAKELAPETIDKLCKLMADGTVSLEAASAHLADKSPAEGLAFIMDAVKALTDGKVAIVFDMTLIRGQGYYTGPVFEIRSTEFRGSIAGGGRYDGLIGKFIGEKVPAVGFSIGFERIYSILRDAGFTPPTARRRVAFLYHRDEYLTAARLADEMRGDADVSLIEKTGKVGKLINRIAQYGFDAFCELRDGEVVTKELK